MSVGFITHRDAILAAYNDVLDSKSKTNWALFGYEGHTNDLKVVSKGENGIEELSEEFNSGKLMYAVCIVTDPKTNLPKCVLIIWQGEGAPAMRKGICANHIPDVKKYFKAATITVTARTDEEVDPESITEKVFKSSSSSYSFQERGECGSSSPVGTVYRKTIPSQEINIAERDKFWEQQEKEEQTRQGEERHRREQEQLKLEKERRERELKEAHAREALVVERTKNIKEIRTAEKKAEIGLGKVGGAGNKDWEKQQKEDAMEEEERKARSEEMRKERAKEAQQLISQRNINARAVFEQNTAAGQLTINKPVRTSLQDKAKTTPLNNGQVNGLTSNGVSGRAATESHHPVNHLPDSIPPPQEEFRSEDIPPPLPEAGPPSEPIPEKLEILSVDSSAVVNAAGMTVDVTVQKTSIQSVTNGVPDATMERAPFEIQYVNTIGHGVRARALYDYQAADDTEISFDPDDIMTYIEMIDEGWWQGMSPSGEYGLFPANYVELLDV